MAHASHAQQAQLSIQQTNEKYLHPIYAVLWLKCHIKKEMALPLAVSLTNIQGKQVSQHIIVIPMKSH